MSPAISGLPVFVMPHRHTVLILFFFSQIHDVDHVLKKTRDVYVIFPQHCLQPLGTLCQVVLILHFALLFQPLDVLKIWRLLF